MGKNSTSHSNTTTIPQHPTHSPGSPWGVEWVGVGRGRALYVYATGPSASSPPSSPSLLPTPPFPSSDSTILCSVAHIFIRSTDAARRARRLCPPRCGASRRWPVSRGCPCSAPSPEAGDGPQPVCWQLGGPQWRWGEGKVSVGLSQWRNPTRWKSPFEPPSRGRSEVCPYASRGKDLVVVGSLMCASEKENMVVESPLSSVKIRSGRFSTCNRARLLSVEDGQARVETVHALSGTIRSRDAGSFILACSS